MNNKNLVVEAEPLPLVPDSAGMPSAPNCAERDICDYSGAEQAGAAGTHSRAHLVIDHPPRLAPDSLPIEFGHGRSVSQPRIMMLGLRGVPNVQGGVEMHVEMLGQELAHAGWNVEIIGRRPYLTKSKPYHWRKMKIIPLWAPRMMMFEAVTHTFIGVLYAAIRRPDILHLHAVGPGLMSPLARMLGLKVVTTHHGYDYNREKWGPLAKWILRYGEKLAVRTSNAVIAVSKDVAETMKRRHNRNLIHIPNGVAIRPGLASPEVLAEFDLERHQYIVMVARVVPEKRQSDLIAAFARLAKHDWKLVIIGDADHHSGYLNEVETLAKRTPGVVMTGFQSGDRLASLFSQARLFVLPSLHEGMPISLLEALSYGIPVLASDIPANHEVSLPPDDYFPAGDVEALVKALEQKLSKPLSEWEAQARILKATQYAWSSVAGATIDVYRTLLTPDRGKKLP